MKRFFDRDYILGFQFKIEQINMPLKEIDPKSEEEINRIDFEADFKLLLRQFDYDFFERDQHYGCVSKYEQLLEILVNSGENGAIVKDSLLKRIEYINSFPEENDLRDISIEDFQILYISNNSYERILPEKVELEVNNLVLWMYIQNDANDPSYRGDDLRIEEIEPMENFLKKLKAYQPKDRYEKKDIKKYLKNKTQSIFNQ